MSTEEVKKSFFGSMKTSRFLAFLNVFGADKVLEEMCKADAEKVQKISEHLDKEQLAKFDLAPANPDPNRNPDFENKETFNGSTYQNAAPGYREMVVENPTDENGAAPDVVSEPTKDGKKPAAPAKPAANTTDGVKPNADTTNGVEDDKTKQKPAPKKKGDEAPPVTKEWGREITIAKSYEMKRVVIGALYVPWDENDPSTVDSHGHACLKEDIELAAYEFMRKMNIHNVDMQHNFISGYGYVVESYIAKYGDPLFTEGTWVIGVKVTDDEVWAKIQSGEITGFSLAGHAHLRAPEDVVI